MLYGYHSDEETAALQVAKVDYDLDACLTENPQRFKATDIKQVLAVWEGEHDGDDWRWVLALKDGQFAFLQGGCDYTGWDCQSWATSAFASTAESAAEFALGNIERGNITPQNFGLGRLLAVMGGGYMSNAEQVHKELLRQLADGKKPTWRKQKDVEFDLV